MPKFSYQICPVIYRNLQFSISHEKLLESSGTAEMATADWHWFYYPN